MKKEKEVFRCKLCTNFHSLRYCSKFRRMDSEERNRVVRKYEYCINCLAQSHTFRRCQSKNTCRKCQNYHHTLLHRQHLKVKPPSASSREVQKYRKLPNSSNNKPNRKSPKASTNRKTKPTRKTPKAKKEALTPDPKILSEAIRSLASVLCVTHSSASVQGRRHV